MDVSEKIRIFRNNISDFKNENKIYLETDPIKYLPFRLTTLHNFIDLLEKYGTEDWFIKKSESEVLFLPTETAVIDILIPGYIL